MRCWARLARRRTCTPAPGREAQPRSAHCRSARRRSAHTVTSLRGRQRRRRRGSTARKRSQACAEIAKQPAVSLPVPRHQLQILQNLAQTLTLHRASRGVCPACATTAVGRGWQSPSDPAHVLPGMRMQHNYSGIPCFTYYLPSNRLQQSGSPASSLFAPVDLAGRHAGSLRGRS